MKLFVAELQFNTCKGERVIGCFVGVFSSEEKAQKALLSIATIKDKTCSRFGINIVPIITETELDTIHK